MAAGIISIRRELRVATKRVNQRREQYITERIEQLRQQYLHGLRFISPPVPIETDELGTNDYYSEWVLVHGPDTYLTTQINFQRLPTRSQRIAKQRSPPQAQSPRPGPSPLSALNQPSLSKVIVFNSDDKLDLGVTIMRKNPGMRRQNSVVDRSDVQARLKILFQV